MRGKREHAILPSSEAPRGLGPGHAGRVLLTVESEEGSVQGHGLFPGFHVVTCRASTLSIPVFFYLLKMPRLTY